MENKIWTKEQKEYLEKISLKDFDSQQKVKDYVQSEINKTIFYISTGTFVISISFIGYLKNIPLKPWFLISAWICFILTIVAQLSIHILSKWVADKKQTLINDSRKNGFKNSWQESTNNDSDIKKWSYWANKLDMVGFVLPLIGLICLLIFASINLISK